MKNEERKTIPRWLIAGFVMLFVAGIVIGWLIWTLSPVDSTNRSPQLVRVETGESVTSVAASLNDQGLIRSTFVFRLLALLRGSTIQAGLFHTSPADSPTTILAILSSGKVSELQVTLLEGWRIEEIAQRLVEAGLVASPTEFSTEAVVGDSSPTWLKEEFGLRAGDSLEGFLFPDTYRFAVDSTPQTIVNKLLTTFRDRTSELGLTYNDVILASIVEREALFDEDRASIAGVYANRLRIGMKLDADPTVQYGKANKLHGCSEAITGCATPKPALAGEGWWPVITAADYTGVDSPFNTYRVGGLPPTPISNPSLASLQAASQPTKHDYLYFLHDAEGHTHFAKTVEEHTRNKREFLH